MSLPGEEVTGGLRHGIVQKPSQYLMRRSLIAAVACAMSAGHAMKTVFVLLGTCVFGAKAMVRSMHS